MENNNVKTFPDLGFARVLVVDDMPSNLVVVAALLKKFKIQADCVGSGQEALDKIKGGNPVYNAIFMDHLMPGMDGMETTAQIRGLDTEYAKNITVIAMTGETAAESEKMFLENGFQAFMEKPLSLAKLEPVLLKWIRERPA